MFHDSLVRPCLCNVQGVDQRDDGIEDVMQILNRVRWLLLGPLSQLSGPVCGDADCEGIHQQRQLFLHPEERLRRASQREGPPCVAPCHAPSASHATFVADVGHAEDRQPLELCAPDVSDFAHRVGKGAGH